MGVLLSSRDRETGQDECSQIQILEENLIQSARNKSFTFYIFNKCAKISKNMFSLCSSGIFIVGSWEKMAILLL